MCACLAIFSFGVINLHARRSLFPLDYYSTYMDGGLLFLMSAQHARYDRVIVPAIYSTHIAGFTLPTGTFKPHDPDHGCYGMLILYGRWPLFLRGCLTCKAWDEISTRMTCDRSNQCNNDLCHVAWRPPLERQLNLVHRVYLSITVNSVFVPTHNFRLMLMTIFLCFW
jgi:hypothetical protein